MKYYMVAEIVDVLDPTWVEAYVDEVTRMVEEHGGRYLARTDRTEKPEGERDLPQLSIIVEWPSKEALDTFYASDVYAPHRAARETGARTEILVFAGEDTNGVANMA